MSQEQFKPEALKIYNICGALVAACVVLVLVMLFLGGCAGRFEEARIAGRAARLQAPAAPPTPYCLSLDSEHRTWDAIAKGGAVIAGAEGLAAIPIDDKTGRIVLAGGTVLAAAVTAVAVAVSDGAATSWARDCSQ